MSSGSTTSATAPTTLTVAPTPPQQTSNFKTKAAKVTAVGALGIAAAAFAAAAPVTYTLVTITWTVASAFTICRQLQHGKDVNTTRKIIFISLIVLGGLVGGGAIVSIFSTARAIAAAAAAFNVEAVLWYSVWITLMAGYTIPATIEILKGAQRAFDSKEWYQKLSDFVTSLQREIATTGKDKFASFWEKFTLYLSLSFPDLTRMASDPSHKLWNWMIPHKVEQAAYALSENDELKEILKSNLARIDSDLQWQLYAPQHIRPGMSDDTVDTILNALPHMSKGMRKEAISELLNRLPNCVNDPNSRLRSLISPACLNRFFSNPTVTAQIVDSIEKLTGASDAIEGTLDPLNAIILTLPTLNSRVDDYIQKVKDLKRDSTDPAQNSQELADRQTALDTELVALRKDLKATSSIFQNFKTQIISIAQEKQRWTAFVNHSVLKPIIFKIVQTSGVDLADYKANFFEHGLLDATKNERFKNIQAVAMGIPPGPAQQSNPYRKYLSLPRQLETLHSKLEAAGADEEVDAIMFFGNFDFKSNDYEDVRLMIGSTIGLHEISDELVKLGLKTENDYYTKGICSKGATKDVVKRNLAAYIQAEQIKISQAAQAAVRSKTNQDLRSRIYSGLTSLSFYTPSLSKVHQVASQIFYRIAIAAMVITPILINPEIAAIGFGVGMTYYTVKWLVPSVGPVVSDFFGGTRFDFISSLITRRNLFSLTPATHRDINAFTNSDLFGRMRILNFELFLTGLISIANFTYDINEPSGTMGSFLQGIFLAREVTEGIGAGARYAYRAARSTIQNHRNRSNLASASLPLVSIAAPN